MSDSMKVQPFDVLLKWMLKELEERQSIFGIHRSQFYTPKPGAPYASTMFGHPLGTPIGPAAGPHTQLTQNIISSWLTGGRFIELKTVQIMDELEIPRPCIDMEDEGYNVEWSQELKLDLSTNEYINAWALLHILPRVLGFEGQPFDTIFNMSVGYNLEGLQSAPMTRFMDRMKDASAELAEIRATLRAQFPQFADIDIPSQLVNSVTLSTMHGCPPEEIERIARYVLETRGLHTTVKLNPTLLGKERVLGILHDDIGFTDINIPDSVFEHDLKYERAVALIKALKQSAAERNLTFGVKLSNTLAMANHKTALPGKEMYMSGRALYPVTMNLFHKLAQEFNGDPSTGSGQGLNVSYSAGADALNVSTLLACGARPVTVASDLLQPGGYAKFGQYLENLEAAMLKHGAANLDDFAQNKLAALEQAAADALTNPRYKKDYHPYALPKVESGLELFDCVTAPCVEACPVRQDVPEYAWLIAQGKYDDALQVILARNPLPGITGYICTHVCQTRCTRNNYDEPVAIRVLKRFAVENGQVKLPSAQKKEHKVAVIGAGPSGLAAASFLALNGVRATIFEAKDMAGGMPAIAPAFRIPPAVIQEDIDRITDLGVEIKFSIPITTPPQELLKQGYEAVYLAFGYPKDSSLDIEGIQGKGVFSSLEMLEQAIRGEELDLGQKVLVIGGGNTAMDSARTAQRLIGQPVTVVYRRTRAEMPAEVEEIEELLAEGNILEELVTPKRVILKNGRVVALECLRNQLGQAGPDGRRKPVAVPGSEFELPADSIILAIGQAPEIAFGDGHGLTLRKDGAVAVDPATGAAGPECVYAGGDAVRGPTSIIAACADGRRAAEAICQQLGVSFAQFAAPTVELSEEEIVQVKLRRARKEAEVKPDLLPVRQRGMTDVVELTLTESAARREAERCLQCSTFCDKCVEVCPNRANYTFFIEPVSLRLPQLACAEGKLTVTGETRFEVAQARQILHVDDLCNECGNCSTFCVHQGKPYLEKPRLFFKESDFALEKENAFLIRDDTVRRRSGGQEAQLSARNGTLTFENAQVRLSLTPEFEIKEMALKEAFEGTLSLKEAAEMLLVFKGVKGSLPFLLVGS